MLVLNLIALQFLSFCAHQVMISLESMNDNTFRTDAVKRVFIGLLRDLRGIVMATLRSAPSYL